MHSISPKSPYPGPNQKTVSVEQSEQTVATQFPNHDLQSQTISNPIFRPLPSQKEIALKKIIVDDAVTAQKNMGVRELSRMANSAAYAKNLAYAEIICKKVRRFVPLGTNAANDVHKTSKGFAEKVGLINLLRNEVHDWVEEYRSSHLGKYPTEIQTYVVCTEALKKYKYGHCGELTKAAFVEAQKNPDISEVHYCASSVGKHAFIVIGKRLGDVWAEDAVVCDAWTEKCYSVAEYQEMQKPQNDVRYAEEYYRAENAWMFSNKCAPQPYLAGELEIKHSWTNAFKAGRMGSEWL